MKAQSLILFYVCLNIALYLVAGDFVEGGSNEYPVLPITPATQGQEYTNATQIQTMFSGLSVVDIGASIGIIGIAGTAIALLSGNLSYLGYGVIGGLLLWVIGRIVPIVDWIVFGFPKFVSSWAATSGEPAIALGIASGIYGLMAFVWFWFFMSLIGQRTVEQ